MWPILISLFINNVDLIPKPKEPVENRFPVTGELYCGTHFYELRPDIQEMLRISTHWDAEDKHIYQLSMAKHPGYFFWVTFSDEWQIISIANNWNHRETKL